MINHEVIGSVMKRPYVLCIIANWPTSIVGYLARNGIRGCVAYSRMDIQEFWLGLDDELELLQVKWLLANNSTVECYDLIN